MKPYSFINNYTRSGKIINRDIDYLEKIEYVYPTLAGGLGWTENWKKSKL
jgi:hypothetical protein